MRLHSIAFLVASAQSVFGQTAYIDAPPTAPSYVSGVVDHAFASISIAIHYFQDYAGNSSNPNTFTRNILSVLANKTGVAPLIRVGGTSADRTTLDVTQKLDIMQVNGPNGIPLNVTIGPSFFGLFNSLPNTRIIFDLSLQRNDSLAQNNTIQVAQCVVNTLGSRLESFEMGNEPDLYALGFVRPANYSVYDYVSEWKTRVNAVVNQVLKNNQYGLSTRLFQFGTFLNVASMRIGANFTLQNAFQAGADSDGVIKTVSDHNYELPAANGTLQNTLMNYTNTVRDVGVIDKDVQYLALNYPSIPLTLGETNSDAQNLGQDQIAGVFGSALWTANYLMQAAATNVSRAYLHQGTTFGYSAWRPVALNGSAPQIRGPFYGIVFFDDFLGSHPNVQIAPLNITGVQSTFLSAFGAYHSKSLHKVAIVNTRFWNTTSTYARGSQNFTMSVPSPYKSAKIEYLCGDGASADDGITWQGNSYNYTSMGYPYRVKNDTTYVSADGTGSITVSVQDVSAVLVTFY